MSDNDKRKKISFSLDPRVYELWVKYCEKYNIDNYSAHIEKIIIHNLKNKIE